MTRMKKRIFGALFAAILVSTVLGPHYILYRRYVSRLRQTNQPRTPDFPAIPHVDATTLRRLGHVATDKQSSFVHFPELKPRGILRIGCFGDSFTHGDEVDDESDYPTILGKLTDSLAPHRIEVLNFGSGWHGFHQAFMAWESIGRRFDLDYVLLGPACFQEERDTTFCHSRDTSAYYLHARYVLKGDGVELLEVDGETYAERFEEYNRFLPRWKYLRFDSNPPAFIDCLAPKGRALPNPFYYLYHRLSRVEEAARTYEVLLRAMADSRPEVPIVLGQPRPRVLTIATKAARPNLLPIQLHDPGGFPYVAPQGHYTRAGNELVARQFLAVLAGRQDVDLSVVQIVGLEDGEEGEEEPTAPADTRTSGIEMAGLIRGEFHSLDSGVAAPYSLQDATAVLAFRAPGDAITDAAFLPIGFPVTNGATVALQYGSGQRRLIGTVARVSSHLGLVEGPWRFRGQKRLELALEGSELPGGDAVSLLVGEREVLRGRAHGSEAVWDGSSESPILRVRARGDGQLPEGGEGIVYLRKASASGELVREPIASWRKGSTHVALEHSGTLVPLQDHR